MDTMQIPLKTRWTAATTAEEVARDMLLLGKNVLVTGGTSGLGFETARVLASAGANVTVTARSPGLTAAVGEMNTIAVAKLELEDPHSIDHFAEQFLRSEKPLHVLILNAGIMATPLARDAAGNESQFSTNHLGHFRLATRLWPALKAAGGARIIVLSSRGHQIGGFDLSDLGFEKRAYN